MSGPLHRLVYRSCLAGAQGADRRQDLLGAIVEASRRRNATNGLTGALLHGGGTVVQVLEGPLEPLEETYERIAADLRHSGLTLLQFVPIPARSFPEWRMASLPASALDAVWPEGGACAGLTADDIPRMIAALVTALPGPDQRSAA